MDDIGSLSEGCPQTSSSHVHSGVDWMRAQNHVQWWRCCHGNHIENGDVYGSAFFFKMGWMIRFLLRWPNIKNPKFDLQSHNHCLCYIAGKHRNAFPTCPALEKTTTSNFFAPISQSLKKLPTFVLRDRRKNCCSSRLTEMLLKISTKNSDAMIHCSNKKQMISTDSR